MSLQPYFSMLGPSDTIGLGLLLDLNPLEQLGAYIFSSSRNDKVSFCPHVYSFWTHYHDKISIHNRTSNAQHKFKSFCDWSCAYRTIISWPNCSQVSQHRWDPLKRGAMMCGASATEHVDSKFKHKTSRTRTGMSISWKQTYCSLFMMGNTILDGRAIFKAPGTKGQIWVEWQLQDYKYYSSLLLRTH